MAPSIVVWDTYVKGTNQAEGYVYEYTVYWKDLYNLNTSSWYKKIFASLQEAKKFAKSRVDKKMPLRPYIIKKVTLRRTFKKDAVVEIVIPKDWEKKYTDEYQYVTNFFKVYKI